MMVKLFQYVGWSETKVPSNCNSVIQLINQLERWQQQSGNGPITIICRYDLALILDLPLTWGGGVIGNSQHVSLFLTLILVDA